MIFHHKNKKIPDFIYLHINNIAIERVQNFNLLGLIVNENLSWKPNTNKASTKISKQIGILNKLKSSLPDNILCTLYCSWILAHLSYSILAWGFDLNRLYKLKKRAVRVITCSKINAHNKPLFKKLNLFKLCDMFTSNIRKFYYKYIKET